MKVYKTNNQPIAGKQQKASTTFKSPKTTEKVKNLAKKGAESAGWSILGKAASLIPTPGVGLLKDGVEIFYKTNRRNTESRIKEKHIKHIRKVHSKTAKSDVIVLRNGTVIPKPNHVKEGEEQFSNTLIVAIEKQQKMRRNNNIEGGIEFAGKITSQLTGEKILTPKLIKYIQAAYRLQIEEGSNSSDLWAKVKKATFESGIDGAKQISVYTIKQIISAEE